MIIFSIWLLIWFSLIFLPRILLTGVSWLDLDGFLKAKPTEEWLFNGYRLFLILWLPISIISTAHYFQESQTEIFYLFVFFVPLIGAGFLKGTIELRTGIGWFYGWRLTSDIDYITLRIFRRNYLRLYNFTLDRKRVQFAGIVRLVLNTAVFISLLVVQLF